RHCGDRSGILARHYMDIAVIGAGLAGLSFAASLAKDRCLDQTRCRIVVFERTVELDCGVLQSLPLREQGFQALRDLGFPGGLEVQVSRMKILQWLAQRLPDGTLRCGREFRGLRLEDGRLMCSFASLEGKMAWEGPFDLVVAADGLQSAVRQHAEHCNAGVRVLLLGDARRIFRAES
ncbi:unnamed protein product, partial [Effrenium voratum]